MSKTVLITLLTAAILGAAGIAHSHYNDRQYSLAEKGLEQIPEKLTEHINNLDYIVSGLRDLASKTNDELLTSRLWALSETLENQSMRAWYNRLLVQNLLHIKDAVNLGQMTTILRLSKEPLSNAIHRMNRIGRHLTAEEPLKLIKSARASMHALMAAYEEAIEILKAAILEGKDPE
jgi:hypothetical protein